MIQWPALLGGNHKLVGWLNKFLKSCKSSEIKQVVGPGKLIENSDGKVLVLDPPGPLPEEPPFRIYQGSTWLKAKVATGPVQITGDLIVPSNADTDLTLVTATAKNWIYVDLTTTTAVFAASSSLPTFGIDKIPIGYVDTTDTGDEIQVITQIWKTNIFSPCVT